MRVFALLALCFAAVAAIPANPQRIVGGYQILDHTRYPSIAGLMYSSTTTNYRLACAGTILNNRSVLTAAHCTFGDDLSRWRIYVGSSVLFSGGYRHHTNAIINHPDYNPRTFENDIGLVRTYETIVQNLYTRPASISGSNYNLGDNQVVWAAGWGATSEGGTTVRRLRDVQIRTINQEICQARYAEIGGVVTANMICSGLLDVGGRGQCAGDAGAPLFHNGVVVGVFSWSHGCGRPQYPGINTRVSCYISWIQSNA